VIQNENKSNLQKEKRFQQRNTYPLSRSDYLIGISVSGIFCLRFTPFFM